jgi:hypothetical protein
MRDRYLYLTPSKHIIPWIFHVEMIFDEFLSNPCCRQAFEPVGILSLRGCVSSREMFAKPWSGRDSGEPSGTVCLEIHEVHEDLRGVE